MFKNITVLMVVSFLVVACSGTVKGPITGNTYKVNVGCTKDKIEYDRVREEAMKPADPDAKIIDCPDSSKEIAPY